LLREWPPVCSPSAGAFATPWGHSPEFLRRCIRNAIFQALTQHILAISPPAFSAHRFAHICQRLFSLAPVKPPRAVLSGWLWFKNNRYNRDPRAVLLGETTPNADPQSDGRTFRWLEPKLPKWEKISHLMAFCNMETHSSFRLSCYIEKITGLDGIQRATFLAIPFPYNTILLRFLFYNRDR